MENTTFLKNPTSEPKAILVIDASGSVNTPYGSQIKIFDKFELICQQLPHQEYHVVFWNSNNTDQAFKGGIMKFPFTVTPDKLSTVFKIAREKITGGCLTMPHLGFQAIHDWLASNYSSTIHFLTDGEIGWPAIRSSSYVARGEMRKLTDALVDQIKTITAKHRDVQLCIHAVENKTANFGSTETLNTSAGNDVYKLISENRLTSMVSKFISYTINYPDGYPHISKVKTPVGFVPYGDQYFSVVDTSQFLGYIYDTISNNKDNEDELLKIVQRLSYTLNVLIADKPFNIRSNMIKMFCDMFSQTCIDAVMINFLLTQSIESESMGSASLFAEYRANLKDLYQNANRLLHDNAKSALGITDQVITLPLNLNNNDPSQQLEECLIVSDHHVPDQTVLGFKNGGFLLDQKLIPVLPAHPQISGTISEQCLRQWVRALISKQYNVHVTADEIIYLVMMINLRVQFSFPNQPEVCQAYRQLVTVMLRKKRLNTDTTELARIEEGHLPIPNNGKIENFNRYMDSVAARLGLNDFPPLKMWYYLCLAHSQTLADVQYVHAKALLPGEEKPTLEDLNLRPLLLWKLPTQLEYKCLITLSSTRESGGHRFLDHHNMMGQTCRPRQVLSPEGYQALISDSNTSRCPICYTSLRAANFEWIDPPAPETDQFEFGRLNTDKFKENLPIQAQPRSNHNSYSHQNTANVPKASSHKGTLIVLCGTVGCGKSTYAKKLKELAEEAGYYCQIEGTDKYCLTGSSIQQAVSQASSALADLQSLDHPKKMVIVDACNEKFQKQSLFGVNYSNWNIQRVWVNLNRDQLDDYLAWSLRNVINRQPGEAVLTPAKAGIGVCIDVHQRKARAHFGKKKGNTPISDRSRIHSIDQVLEQINPAADRYQQFLDANPDRFVPKLP